MFSTQAPLVVPFCCQLGSIHYGTVSNGISENASFDWDFGNGSTATGEMVSFSYANAGIYDVSLVITDYNDCSSNTSEIMVIVGATTPGNPYVSAGDDFSIVCETNISYIYIHIYTNK